MLGLGNTVSSGSALESLYSITLDGTDDYVSIDSLASELSDDMAYSLSIWIKGDSNTSSGGGNIFFSAHDAAGSTNIIRIGVDLSGTKGIFYADAGTGNTSNLGAVDLDDGAWHNIIITRPSGSGGQQSKLYIDGGSAITTDLDDSDPEWSSATKVSIGQEWDGTSSSDHYQGEIDEVSFWTVELDYGSVQKIYNQGSKIDVTTGASIDSTYLKGYWRMGNGTFDDKVNGVIHDQHNPGFGNEIFANGWDTLNLGSPAVNSNGRITVETNHSGLLHETGHVSDGAVYKVVMDLETYTGGKIYVGGTQVTPTLGLNTYYIRSAGTNTGFGINDPNNFVASNLSVKKLNGLPGLTSGGPTFSSDIP